MPDPSSLSVSETVSRFSARTLPRWEELPDFELYMDQVLSLVGRALAGYPGFDAKGLTAAMVNNYVKAGLLASPVKKRYTKSHIARLLIVCILKPVLPIASIRAIFADSLAAENEAALYDRFCERFEESCRETASAVPVPRAENAHEKSAAAVRAALRAQSAQALALSLLSTSNRA